LIAIAASAVMGVAALGWHRLGITRPAGPLPLLVVLLAIPVSAGLVTFTMAGVSGGTGGPSVDAWIGIGPALIAVGLIGWVWFSDRRVDGGVSLVVGLGLVAGTVALFGPVALLPAGFGPFVPIALPTLAVGAAWMLDELFRDPERAVLQTTAVVLAGILVAVPLFLGRDRLGAASQPGGVAAVQTVCDALGSRPSVVVVGEDQAMAGGVAAGVAAHCVVPSARGGIDGDVDAWRTAAIAEGRALHVIALDGLTPVGVTLELGPTMEFEVLVPTIGELPADYRTVTVHTAISSR
ncbi:MAG: hypothetical protein KJN71_03210, partial [Acidimicrobiia bacterium]|nr:hypothetical protein [Acidimicrobiia bacterium]